jgi:small subunit ribosomal protein S7
MPRRREIPKREVPLDPLYSSALVTKFISTLMRDGKRSTAEQIMYGSLASIQEKTGDDPVKVFKKAVENVKPALEVKSRRVGGSNYQVPVEVNPNRRLSLSIRWLCPLPWRRQDDAGEAGQRADGCGEPARRRGEEARRHAPDGGSEQGVRALSVVGRSRQ